ncbi:MAG TPA: glycosyl hydrolase, partial [Bacteroidetes bacterium]|nr:glycosyl hydrolase [Bacteroidota bacterium]
MKKIIVFTFIVICSTFSLYGQNEKPKDNKINLENISLSGLTFRSIGPAVTGGRIVDIAVNPKNNSEYYVASGHGNLWKTTNRGITFLPTFDNQNSYSIGAVTLDPQNPNVVWVATGENNAQSNVIPGDGVYKSENAGKTWKNMGLKETEQLGEVIVHPNNSNIIWVAAYGSHRTSGGQRGVFRTKDGGKTWDRVLYISDNTGC